MMNLSYDYNDTVLQQLEEEFRSNLLYEFITNGVLLNIVGGLGIIGNIISMIILTRPQMRSSINYLLVGLVRCDTVLILSSILLFGIPAVYKYCETPFLVGYCFYIYPFLTVVVFPVALIAQTVSVYLTLTVTLERFVAVCHPLQARSLCTYGRARIYVVLIIVFSILFNASRFLDLSIEQEFDYKLNMTIYKPSPTPLRNNPLYISIYINWLNLFVYLFPFTCLAILNTAIYRQVRRANKERQKLSRLQKKEIGLATMLLCVVIVFFICNILALIVNALEALYGLMNDKMIKTSNLLVTINSSVNFIIYVIFGEKFKRLFIKLFCTHGPFCGHGRESPDCNTTHEESIVLNNGETRHSKRNSNGWASTKHQVPGVYYPGKHRSGRWNNDVTATTSVGTEFY